MTARGDTALRAWLAACAWDRDLTAAITQIAEASLACDRALTAAGIMLPAEYQGLRTAIDDAWLYVLLGPRGLALHRQSIEGNQKQLPARPETRMPP